jgi:hypothetical protein
MVTQYSYKKREGDTMDESKLKALIDSIMADGHDEVLDIRDVFSETRLNRSAFLYFNAKMQELMPEVSQELIAMSVVAIA